MNAYGKSADTYLTQRILGASPEQQAALIMEAGQRHLGKAMQAIAQQDLAGAASSLLRVTDAITEATLRLNYEDGGEVVENLEKLYDHWTKELMVAAHLRQTARLEAVNQQMGEIRQAWEDLHQKKAGATQTPVSNLGDQTV